jgi:hypothetical protein
MANEEIREGVQVDSYAEGLSQSGEPEWASAHTYGHRR